MPRINGKRADDSQIIIISYKWFCIFQDPFQIHPLWIQLSATAEGGQRFGLVHLKTWKQIESIIEMIILNIQQWSIHHVFTYLSPQFKYVFSHIFTCKMVCNKIMISLVRRLPMLSLILEHLCLLSLWGKSSWFSCCSVHYITDIKCITQRIGVFLIKIFIFIANNQTVSRQKDLLHDPVMTGGRQQSPQNKLIYFTG